MPKRITIAAHLSKDELERRYRGAKDPIERSHYQIIWLLASGRLGGCSSYHGLQPQLDL